MKRLTITALAALLLILPDLGSAATYTYQGDCFSSYYLDGSSYSGSASGYITGTLTVDDALIAGGGSHTIFAITDGWSLQLTASLDFGTEQYTINSSDLDSSLVYCISILDMEITGWNIYLYSDDSGTRTFLSTTGSNSTNSEGAGYFYLNGEPGTSGRNTSRGVWTREASAVPVPAAIWLLASGLLGLAGMRRRFNS